MHLFRRAAIVPLAMAAVATAAAPAFDRTTSRRLEESVRAGRSYDYARELTETFGARVTGSDAYERSAEWAAAELRRAGADRTVLEPFTLPQRWERGTARARIVATAPGERDVPVPIASLGWTPSTPADGIEAEVTVVSGPFDPQSIRGRIVLLDRELSDEVLRDAGARAILVPDAAAGNELTARPRQFGGRVGLLPAATVGRDDADAIRRAAARGPVRMAIDIQNLVTSGPATVHNVVAELTGGERPDEWVIVGAHLDSWDFATGAQDNATGVAMVMEAARAIAALGRRPRRSLRFALWGGEEQGMIGSSAYVRGHAQEIGRCAAVLNTDGGTGRIIGWSAPGRDDVASALRPLSSALLDALGSGGVDTSAQYVFDSDHAAFVRAGVPALDLNPDETGYWDVHHKAGDTLSRVDREHLAVGAATVAITAYALADAPRPIAAHRPIRK